MASPLRPIIEQIAREADDFLAGHTSREQARAGIAELMTMDYNFLAPSDRKIVTEGVMAALEFEDFFGAESGGNPFEDELDDGKQ